MPKEHTADGSERRVAQTPESVAALVKKGLNVVLETGAGLGSNFRDADYERVGARVADAGKVLSGSDIVLKVRPPSAAQAKALKEGGLLLSFLYPAVNKDIVSILAERSVTSMGMEQVPRITRAQQFDALSSMANISGAWWCATT